MWGSARKVLWWGQESKFFIAVLTMQTNSIFLVRIFVVWPRKWKKLTLKSDVSEFVRPRIERIGSYQGEALTQPFFLTNSRLRLWVSRLRTPIRNSRSLRLSLLHRKMRKRTWNIVYKTSNTFNITHIITIFPHIIWCPVRWLCTNMSISKSTR